MKRTTTIANDLAEFQGDLKVIADWLTEAEDHMRENEQVFARVDMAQAMRRMELTATAMSVTMLDIERRVKK